MMKACPTVAERVAEFRDQVGRRLSGELTEDEFKPLRLMNGVYLQLHAYMARISIPYGTLSSDQLRMLAHVGRRYDRGEPEPEGGAPTSHSPSGAPERPRPRRSPRYGCRRVAHRRCRGP